MERMDNLWTQLFPDKPVPEQTLLNLKQNIMTEILSHPVDFAAEALLAQRRRWGLLFAGSWLGLGIAALLLVWFKGQAILPFLSHLLAGTWLAAWGEILLNKLTLFLELKMPMEFLWQEYSWQLTGIIIIGALFIDEVLRQSRWSLEDSQVKH